jgi:putative DNA primase/helicase
MLRWLLSLRHRGVAVILIHHAGKSGKQRGASRREDLLDTSIALEQPDDEDSTPHPGAHFVMKFVKNRHPKPKPDVLELRLTDNRGQLYWQFNEPQKIDRATEILLSIWEHNPETQKELGERVGLTKGAISQHCSTLRKAGYLTEGPALSLTPIGRERLIEVWPDLEPRMLKQGDLLARDVI